MGKLSIPEELFLNHSPSSFAVEGGLWLLRTSQISQRASEAYSFSEMPSRNAVEGAVFCQQR